MEIFTEGEVCYRVESVHLILASASSDVLPTSYDQSSQKPYEIEALLDSMTDPFRHILRTCFGL